MSLYEAKALNIPILDGNEINLPTNIASGLLSMTIKIEKNSLGIKN
ncbi:hypothetical protein [Endozoicomonas sp.]